MAELFSLSEVQPTHKKRRLSEELSTSISHVLTVDIPSFHDIQTSHEHYRIPETQLLPTTYLADSDCTYEVAI